MVFRPKYIMRQLITEASDYKAFVQASKKDGNYHFHFTCPIHRVQAIDAFLEKMAKEHGLIYCDAASPVDKDYLVAGPRAICRPLERMLHSWAQKQGKAPLVQPKPEEPRKGILARILGN